MRNKADIVMELEGVVATRLFGPSFRSWLIGSQTDYALTLHRRKIELGLVQENDDGICVYTPLGAELHAELLSVFMGHCDPFDGLRVLNEHGLVGDSVFNALAKDFERLDYNDEWLEILHGVVKKAYAEFRGGKVLH